MQIASNDAIAPSDEILPLARDLPPAWTHHDVHRIEDWHSKVGDCYFPLEVDRYDRVSEELNGRIAKGQIGHLQISRLRSSPVVYRRERRHFHRDNEQNFLVTLPHGAPVRFNQFGREVICDPSDFILETSSAPYVFEYEQANAMTVIKVPGRLLSDRIATPEDFCAMRYSGREGSGALFLNMVQSIIAQADHLTSDVALRCSEHAIDLLALALTTSTPNRARFSSSVRRCHLDRVSLHILHHLADMELSPQSVSAVCGLSVRYLHLLFEPTGWTCWQWIRECRLSRCFNALLDPCHDGRAISELCYRWGFSDQATFSRAFKARFAMTPGDVRRNRATLRPLTDPRFELFARSPAD
jgi:AraC-like DNA-binding protein